MEKKFFMNLIKPKKLQKGDTIGLLSVSGNIRDITAVENAAKYFQNLGYKTIVSQTSYKNFRYMAGSDKERIYEIHNFFINKNIDAIVCTRGGYGLLRIIPYLDYKLIAKNPKIICGYSDITALLLMIYKNTGMICFHGGMASGDFGQMEKSEFTVNSFFKTLSTNEKLEFSSENGNTIYEGKTNGTLWGGNLATIASMTGLDFIPDEDLIFFVEDVNEPAYKIDRMFTQLLNINKFKNNLKGLVVGQFTDVDKKNYVRELLTEISSDLKIPTANNFLISHEKDKFTLPIGANCTFNANEKILTINEKLFS